MKSEVQFAGHQKVLATIAKMWVPIGFVALISEISSGKVGKKWTCEECLDEFFFFRILFFYVSSEEWGWDW